MSLSDKKLKRKAKKKDFLVKYSINGEKVLKLSFKPNGVYQEYVGSINKDKSESTYLKNQITVWQKNGEFVHQHELEGFKEKFYKKEQK